MGVRLIGSAALLAVSLTGCDAAPPAPPLTNEATAKRAAPEPLPDVVRVRIDTGIGPIVVALDAKRAPVTTANFVRYAEEKRLDGTSFYRASPTKGAEPGTRGFIQGGIRRSYRRMLPAIAHEATSDTGLRHEAGTISMARSEDGGATGDFFITASAQPAMDSKPGERGYAAFGKVIEGMDVVRRILQAPTDPQAGRGAMRGQMLAEPVPIVTARRIE